MAQQHHGFVAQQHHSFVALNKLRFTSNSLDVRTRTPADLPRNPCAHTRSQPVLISPPTPLAPVPTPAAPTIPFSPPAPPPEASDATTVDSTVDAPPPPTLVPRPTGMTLDRAALEIHASGRISEIFGPAFAEQDRYHRQVRMPEPPLLLADRMTGLDAAPTSMKLGTIWTETDVKDDSWYLHHGRMPAGLMIESGQADLMLISYLGIDLLNQSERVYRLLGCELSYHGPLPEPGDTLCYDIHVDGHASQGDARAVFSFTTTVESTASYDLAYGVAKPVSSVTKSSQIRRAYSGTPKPPIPVKSPGSTPAHASASTEVFRKNNCNPLRPATPRTVSAPGSSQLRPTRARQASPTAACSGSMK